MTGQSKQESARPGRRRWLRNSLNLAVAVVVIGAVIYATKFSRVPVSAHRADFGPVVAVVMGTGTLEAHVAATISPKIQGRLIEVSVDQNDRVQAGQVLARLEDTEWREQVAVAVAGVDAAMATVERARADEVRAQAVLAQARISHGRATDLRKADIASQSDLDLAVERLRVAEADLTRARAAITEVDRQKVTAQKNLAYHQARLADTRMLSPFDGLVVRRDRDPGDLGVPGSSVLYLISTRELWISAWVDETAMRDLAVGQTARVVFRSEPSKSYPGEVARLGRQVDRETREFVVDVRVAELPTNWAVGQRAEVFIETARSSSALVIPREFVFWRDGKPGVFVDASGKARWRELTLGLQGEAVVEVTQGLQEGEDVLRSTDDKSGALAEGARIKES